MNPQTIREILKTKLGRKRYEHSLRVEKLAEELARHFGVDAAKAQTAALLHDVSRFLDRAGMLEYAEKLEFNISESERAEPKLLHARLSRHFAEQEFGVTDPEILGAIEYHTVGRPNMGLLEKIIYAADHAEAGRDHPGIDEIQKLARQNLDQAISLSTRRTIEYLREKKLPIDQRTIETNRFYSKMG